MIGGPVLLTGASGFLGGHLLRALVGRGVPAIVLKRRTSDTSRIADLLPRVTVHDVESASLHEIFAAHDVRAVVHLATAYGRGRPGMAEVLEANVLFPTRLLESAGAAGVPLFLNADSFSTKGDALPDVLDGYVLSKRQFREVGALVARRLGVRFTSLQIEHLYGPADGAAKFIPTMIRACLAHAPTFALTPGDQRRDFVYVDDVVAAFLAALERAADLPATLEVGTGTEVTLADAVRLLRDLCESETRLDFGALPYRSGELMASHADRSALDALGWAPRVALADGLARTIRSMRDEPGPPRQAASRAATDSA